MIIHKLTRPLTRVGLKAKKNSPHIFFAAGVAGVVTGGVLACKATLKLEETLDDIQNDLNILDEAQKREVRDEKELMRFRTAVYIKSGSKFLKLYGPAIAISTLGIVSLTGSHIQLSRRNAALQAALAAVTTAYEEYRQRIQKEIGEEREEKIFRNLDGIAEKDAPVGRDPNKFSVYARCFDECSPNWQKDPELNRIFVQLQQNYANHRLQQRGHLFLNEVYDVLGFDRSSIGSVVGWIFNGDGDNYIDFGIFETRNSEFVNGVERSAWLDFNVDGVIFDKI